MQFIAFYTMSTQEKEELRKQFISLDEDGDGLLSKEELTKGYMKVYQNDQARCEEIVNRVLEQCNNSQSGQINFHGRPFALHR